MQLVQEAPTGLASFPVINSQQTGAPTASTASPPEGNSGDDITLHTTTSSSSSRDTAVNSTSPLFTNKVKQASSCAPYALTWSEYGMELRPARPLNSSKPQGVTSGVFPRWEHSCTAIPSSTGEFIIFGGKAKPDKEEVWTNDVILLSTNDMSLTSLETSGAKPKARTGHRTVLAGRAVVVFGGNKDDSYLHFLSLGNFFSGRSAPLLLSWTSCADTWEWSRLRQPAPYPGSRFGHSFIIVNSVIWLYGGALARNKLDDMWCIDLGTGKHLAISNGMSRFIDALIG